MEVNQTVFLLSVVLRGTVLDPLNRKILMKSPTAWMADEV